MPAFQFDDGEAIERKLVPVDWYLLEVANVEVKQSKTNKPMLSVMFNIIGGEYDKQSLFSNFMLVGKAGGITKGFLRAATGDPAGGSRDTSELVGCRLRARVTQKVWAEEQGGDGELQNQISKYQAADTNEVFG